jgi:hypothetical protein
LGVSGNERLGQGQGYVPLQKSTPGTMAKTNVEQIPGLKPLVSVLINTNWTRIRCDFWNQVPELEPFKNRTWNQALSSIYVWNWIQNQDFWKKKKTTTRG